MHCPLQPLFATARARVLAIDTMPAMRIGRPASILPSANVIFPFLAPSVHCARSTAAPVAQFSTSSALWKRDNNRNRGVSILRHTGVRKRQTLSVRKYALPKPVQPATPIEGDQDHGLWAFFPENKKLLRTPVEISRHGRSWEVHELRKYNLQALHKIWWLCAKERNRLATEKLERRRLNTEHGDTENKTRDQVLQGTMKAILDALSERNAAYEEARDLARRDPEIDLNLPINQLQQLTYDTDELVDELPEDEVTAEEQQKLDQVKQAQRLPDETSSKGLEDSPAPRR